MGLTYEELSLFGRLRSQGRCGPYSMFVKLCALVHQGLLPNLRAQQPLPQVPVVSQASAGAEGEAVGGEVGWVRSVASKVRHFFTSYAANRHKQTVLPPAVHAESYSPDDNRFDHRPFLYNSSWTWQFQRIEDELHSLPLPLTLPLQSLSAQSADSTG